MCLCQIFADRVSAQETTDIGQLWQESAHANSDSEAFRHWDDEGEIPTRCATCHSMSGFQDYTGEDGTAVGTVESAVKPGTNIGCTTCHHSALTTLDSIAFRSSATVSDTGTSTTCIVCHQGVLSTVQVDEALHELEDDVPSVTLSFLNIHYKAAAASLYGGETASGYEYAGKQYVGRFPHPEPLDTCSGCHDPHALEVRADQCTSCHQGTTSDTLSNIRMASTDVDGDGDVAEGVSGEISTLHELLGGAIEQYAKNVAGQAVIYTGQTYPYFFNDIDSDGLATAEESVYPNRYQSWTPRLLRAAYNYQFVAKDPGVYSHNPRYALQLLVDSLEDLNRQIKLELPSLQRP